MTVVGHTKGQVGGHQKLITQLVGLVYKAGHTDQNWSQLDAWAESLILRKQKCNFSLKILEKGNFKNNLRRLPIGTAAIPYRYRSYRYRSRSILHLIWQWGQIFCYFVISHIVVFLILQLFFWYFVISTYSILISLTNNARVYLLNGKSKKFLRN